MLAFVVHACLECQGTVTQTRIVYRQYRQTPPSLGKGYYVNHAKINPGQNSLDFLIVFCENAIMELWFSE